MVERGAAQIEDVVALDLEIDVLKAGHLGIVLPPVDEVGQQRPVFGVVRYHQRQKIPRLARLMGEQAADDGVVFTRDRVLLDHELGMVAGQPDGM